MQKDRNTNKLYIGYNSPKTPGKSYIYNIAHEEKKNLLKKKLYHQVISPMIIL